LYYDGSDGLFYWFNVAISRAFWNSIRVRAAFGKRHADIFIAWTTRPDYYILARAWMMLYYCSILKG
jgi:hypothetical protein